jgi:hypothetical protein
MRHCRLDAVIAAFVGLRNKAGCPDDLRAGLVDVRLGNDLLRLRPLPAQVEPPEVVATAIGRQIGLALLPDEPMPSGETAGAPTRESWATSWIVRSRARAGTAAKASESAREQDDASWA